MSKAVNYIRPMIGLTVACAVSFSLNSGDRIQDFTIARIQKYQVEDALTLFYKTAFELQLLPSQAVADLRQTIEQAGGLTDMNDMAAIQEAYLNNHGIFLVIEKEERLIGTGALQKIDDQTCEFKRIYLDVRYRNKGLGAKLMEQLFYCARQFGYKKVRLCVFDPVKQAVAISFYKKFGFYAIAPYKDCEARVFMEKLLDE